MLDFQRLVAVDGAAPGSTVKMVLCGNAGVGKTTLVKALQASWFESVVGVSTPAEKEPGRGRTRGVEVTKLELEGKSLSIWDVGGQEQYNLLHQFVHGGENTIYIVVVTLSDGPEARRRILGQWLRGIRAGLKKGVRGSVTIVGSHADKAKDDAKEWMHQVVVEMQELFGDKLDIDIEGHVVTCKAPRSVAMKRLKRDIQSRHEHILSGALPVPRVCARVLEVLPTLRVEHEQCPIVSMQDVLQRILGATTEKEIRQRIARYVFSEGEILPGSEDWEVMVLELNWLLRDVLGDVLAPKEWEKLTKVVDGVITVRALQKATPSMKLDQLVETLQTLRIALKTHTRQGEAALMVPWLLERESTITEEFSDFPHGLVLGRQVICTQDIDLVTPGLFPAIQVQLRLVCGVTPMWKGGMRIAKEGAEGVVTLLPESRGIDIRVGVRDTMAHSQAAALALMCQTVAIIFDMATSICPGVDLHQRVIRTKDVVDKIEGCEVTSYDIEACQNAANNLVYNELEARYDNVVEMVAGMQGATLNAVTSNALEMLLPYQDPFAALIPVAYHSGQAVTVSSQPWRQLDALQSETRLCHAFGGVPLIGDVLSTPFFNGVSASIAISHLPQVSFESWVEAKELQREERGGPFNPTLDHPSQRAQLKLLKKMFIKQSETSLSHVNVMIGFQGCSASDADRICKNGAVDLAKIDAGYFGRGIYVTPDPEYALMFSPRDRVMVMFLVAVGVTYPITREVDYAQPADMDSHSDFYDDYYRNGQALKRGGYDSHFATVVKVRKDLLVSYEQSPTGSPYQYREVVLKESAQLLPICKITFPQASRNESSA